MRKEVTDFLALGTLPNSDSTQEDLVRFEEHILAIEAPVTDEEAEHLIECFGEDDCYGLAWTLLHLIETSPTPYPRERPIEADNMWKSILYERYLASLKQA